MVRLSDGSGRIVDAASGRLLHLLLPDDQDAASAAGLRNERLVTSILFSPDGRLALSATRSGQVRFWDAGTGRLTRDLHIPSDDISALALSPNGRRLATGHLDGMVRLWDARQGVQCLELRGHQAAVRIVTFSPDGRTLASGGEDNTARLWMSADRKEADRRDEEVAALRRAARRRAVERQKRPWETPWAELRWRIERTVFGY